MVGATARVVALAIGLATGFTAPAAQARDSAVIVMYNGFGDGSAAWTPLDLFDSHIAFLRDNDYTVLPLSRVVGALSTGAELPDRTVALTLDSGHISIFRDAWPRLKAAGFPFTLFVATDMIDAGGANRMSWDQIRELASAGVAVGSHGAAYKHLAAQDIDSFTAGIDRANRRFVDELGATPELFAHPYGEYDLARRDIVARRGFVAALGQQSGAVHGGADFHALPRFLLAGRFADLKRFSLVADTLPLPVTDLVPKDPLLGANPPLLGFTVVPEIGAPGGLSCYASPFGQLPVERLGPSRIEVRFPKALAAGRTRVNCTMAGPEGRFRWLGLQFLVPDGR